MVLGHQHPSATIKPGTTLVPETVRIVQACMKHVPIQTSEIESFVKNVHSTLVKIALQSEVVGDDLDRLGYQASHPREATEIRRVAERVAPAIVSVPNPASSSKPLPAPRPEPVQSAHSYPQREMEPQAHHAPSNVVDIRQRKPRKQTAHSVSNIDLRTTVEMEFIRCLEDGKKVRDLARHLFEQYDMSPEEYRRKWGLPDSYPMHPPGIILRRGDQFEVDIVTGTYRALRRKS